MNESRLYKEALSLSCAELVNRVGCPYDVLEDNLAIAADSRGRLIFPKWCTVRFTTDWEGEVNPHCDGDQEKCWEHYFIDKIKGCEKL